MNARNTVHRTDPFDLNGQWRCGKWCGRAKKFGCWQSLACQGARHGTYTGSFNGGFVAGSFSFTAHGGSPRLYGGVGFSFSRPQKVGRAKKPWVGASLGWNPGSPNERKPVSGGVALCRRYCGGVSSGYKGKGTWRGYSPFVGVGYGSSAWAQSTVPLWRYRSRGR